MTGLNPYKNPLRILLIGSNGQIGSALRKTLTSLGDVMALNRVALDLCDPNKIRKTVREHKPSLIVNAAAYTAVDQAESEPNIAMSINGVAPGLLAEEARHLGAAIVHYSTDYVFDGTKNSAYIEKDAPNPINIYGRTKLEGERAVKASIESHYILRTSWVYSSVGKNFMNTILRLAREKPELRIVDDQIGAPTWAESIAQMTTDLLKAGLISSDNPRYGTYHMTASGSVSWFGFTKAILDEARNLFDIRTTKLTPITTPEYPLPACRPNNSQLDNRLLRETFGISPASWEDMLVDCMRNTYKK